MSYFYFMKYLEYNNGKETLNRLRVTHLRKSFYIHNVYFWVIYINGGSDHNRRNAEDKSLLLNNRGLMTAKW